MRNLKKILALVLALVMSLSLMATAGAADFSDADQITDKYADAVTVLNGLEVFKGYDNGATFQPQGDITRAEVAAIIYRIATGDVTDTQKDIYSTWGLFTDVADGSWYAGYVNYCANAGYIKGRGNKIFDPNGKVTGYEALAMILRAIGYDKNNEFSGTNWQVNTASIAKQRGITNNITDTLLGQAATREVVAEILFQAILVPTVTFNTATLSYTNNATSLGKDVLNLDKVTGVVVANEYANVQDDDLKVLAEGKTQLRVAAGDVRTLDLGTDLTDIGMAENAYIQGSKVLLISEADNTVFDNTDKNGEHVDISSASKFSSVSGLSKNDDTEFFVNFDHSTEHKANRRIELRVTFKNDGAEAAFDKYASVNVSKVAAENDYSVYVNGNKLTGKDILDYSDLTGYGYPVEYVKVFRLEDVVTDNDLKVLRGIFGMADDSDATTWDVEGKVYVGTNSQDVTNNYYGWYEGDKSNTMSFSAFKEEYIDTDLIKNWSTSDDGEWVKIIDNNGDGIADYAFRTDFTLDKAVNTYTSGDESTLRYYGLDIIKSDYTARYMNTVAEGDIVLWTVIDDQALIWKAETAEDEVTKINDIYSRKVTATTKGGETYSQSEIENASRLDQRIDQMDETVNYRMYLDAFGRIRAYEPVDGNRYALITELYYGNLRNGRYVVDDVLTAELKAGDAGLTERVVNNPLNNDFILNFSNNGNSVLDTWTELNNFMDNERTVNGLNYVKNLYKDWPTKGINITRPLAGGDWSDYVVLQPAVAHLGFPEQSTDALKIFRNATTNVARYVVNADGTVNLSTAAQINRNADGTLAGAKNGNYAVDYVQLDNSRGVSSKQNTYTGINVDAGFSTRVDATSDTEYYIVSNSGVEHFVGYSKLPAISGIRSMYAVARNTSTDYSKSNYWVAEVIVIEADNYSAQPDDYIFVIGRADMVNPNGTLANRQAVGSQYLYGISAKQGAALRIAPTNLSWGVGTVTAGFYKAYGAALTEDGMLTVDRLTRVEPDKVTTYGDASYNTSNFKLRAGYINRVDGLKDLLGVTMAGSNAQRQITLKGPSFAINQDNRTYVSLSTRLDGDNWTNQLTEGNKILWVEDGSSNALFTIDVTQSKTLSDYDDDLVALLGRIYVGVSYAQGKGDSGETYTVTVKGVYGTDPNKKDDGVVYLQKADGNYLNAANGTTFQVAKGTNSIIFKVSAGYPFELNGDPMIPSNNAKLTNRQSTLGNGWWEITDIKGDFTIEVPVAKDNTAVKQTIVQSNTGKFNGTLLGVDVANNKLTKDSYVALTPVSTDITGKKITVSSVRVGNTVLTSSQYTFDSTNCWVKFTDDKGIDYTGDIVIVLNVSDIEAVATTVEAPLVARKSSNKPQSLRNARLANDDLVPLFFVNNYNWTKSEDGTKAIFNLGTNKVGTEIKLTFRVNSDADLTGWGDAVHVYIPGTDVYVTLPMTANATASATYEVKAVNETEVIAVVPVENVNVDLEPVVKVGGKVVTGSLNVYDIIGDTKVDNIRVTVTDVDKAATISVYTVVNDTQSTPVKKTGSVDTSVSIAELFKAEGAQQITLKVEVSYPGKETVVKSYALTYSKPATPPETTGPTTPDTGTEDTGTTA